RRGQHISATPVGICTRPTAHQATPVGLALHRCIGAVIPPDVKLFPRCTSAYRWQMTFRDGPAHSTAAALLARGARRLPLSATPARATLRQTPRPAAGIRGLDVEARCTINRAA